MARPLSTWLTQSILAAALTLAQPARAEITFAYAADSPLGSLFAARLTGEITAADLHALQGQMETAALAGRRQMQLNSAGGDVDAALAIGRLMRSLEFDSMVLPRGQCDSACVFVLAAGIDKVVEGTVGIHRPYFSRIAVAEVGAALQGVKADVEAYLAEMNIPTRLVEDMFSTDPAEMRVLTEAELGAYRLNSQDYVVREERAQRMADDHGLSREAYEAFRQDMNYRCRIFTGQPEPLKACVREVAARHGISL
ncbi:COG3904 family protein [Gemmobacter serpentinus]|uniref:ATP-dependent Clp protease proteolytic subunit n=1 Tax=Gemmobacter serpentinus TaxID=2652247 RepID=UPI00124C08AF|nr:ATP-dependent Clp protease proteolytic subunit [Gemmobacter serpentinus]